MLAPARNLQCGIAAIDHGADAVYIGAPRFGARAAVGNSIEDIKQLCDYAHAFMARVYVTVNTILYENELEDIRLMLKELSGIGVDAILVQDMSILRMDTGDMELHASTQTDNRTPEKVSWLKDMGFSRVVLARELSLEEISVIHQSVPDVELEAFVHGALCVSYSGQCYISHHCLGRSANRGECAQLCRVKYDLVDADDNVIERQRYLLSLRDMCRIDNIENLLSAGVTSLKIEGRLKDISYVKNVVAAYSNRLNDIIRRNPDKYQRASLGRCEYSFTPNLEKSFNRGFTSYMLDGKRCDISSIDTPKAVGEYVGRVKEIRGNSFNVSSISSFANGDGLCFLNGNKQLEGFRVNRVEGNRLFLTKIPDDLRPGTKLYRNSDHEFEKLLSKPSCRRRISVDVCLGFSSESLVLTMSVSEIGKAEVCTPYQLQKAEKPQRENIMRQLAKLGNTNYICDNILLSDELADSFIPSGILADMRRRAVEALDKVLLDKRAKRGSALRKNTVPQPYSHDYMYNVSNSVSRGFYEECAGRKIGNSFETGEVRHALLMQCRHCIRYTLGYCVRHGGRRPEWKEPLYLKMSDGRKLRLEFKCSECQMNVYAND